MNLEELRSVQRAERQKDSLQHLRDSFYEDVAAYIAQLKDERERAVEAAADPFASDDVRQLTDRIEATTEIANALYERRVGKVVKHASFAAADMAADEEGMTAEERDLFADLVARIRENRETVLATLEGAHDGTPDPAAESTADAETTASPSADTDAVAADTDADADPTDDLLADALGDPAAAPEEHSPTAPPAGSEATTESTDTAAGGPDDERPTAEAAAATTTPESPAESGSTDGNGTATTDAPRSTDGQSPAVADGSTGEQATPDTDRTTLRITADVGTVYGVDEREYDLAREDVVDLPTTNAEPLLRKNAAERID